MADKIDQVLEKLEILEKGQKENHSLIQKNGIKIEQVGSDVKAVAEGHGVLGKKIDVHLRIPHSV